ncbi:MAG: UDP-N-acetylglucosamine--N-acetylmuramyl-(pentapeptide) pyrophosphoryl-undecaprenol N-acetylglucosamine transferase [Patescibacteria group bacterium]|nr:UDP-N-acetylglucosamine--N-acetylmuramyl-(pentapeptide) pyrophosphoryl-undecaprenol N-acetylglucosamine transferase [Patescibacteria group bacterium]
MKILFTGGGTAGHIFPIIAIAREIKRIYPEPNLQFFYLGPRDEFSQILLSQEEINVKHVFSGKIRRYFDWKSPFQNLIDVLFKIPLGILQAFFYIFFLAPDLTFSKGGFGSIPAVMASWFLKVPIFLHESDISPGLSNRFLSKFALEVFVSFPKTEYFKPSKIILVGNPIRREILEGSKEEAQKLFKLSGTKPVILILGGSQGAQRINDKILEILPELLKNFEIIHQSGEKNFEEVKAESRVILPEELASFYHLFPFLNEEELKQAYAACDLVVSRAGSGSIFEIAAARKPSILIPLSEAAQNHQFKNAYAYAEKGATIVLEEANFTPHFFLEKLRYLFFRPPSEVRDEAKPQRSEELEKMQKAAEEFSKPLAAQTIASYLIEFLK